MAAPSTSPASQGAFDFRDTLPGGIVARVLERPDPGELAAQAVAVLARHLRTRILAVGYSGGKDSTVTLVLALLAAVALKRDGVAHSPIFVLSGDTEIENPSIANLRDRHLEELARWAEAEGIEVVVRIYRPQLSATWAVKVLSGSALPRYPNSRTSDCSVSWKVDPAEKALRNLVPQYLGRLRDECAALPSDHPARGVLERAEANPVPVAVLGSRFSESQARASSMAKHAQASSEITSRDGRCTLSPIAHWEEEDVWEILGSAGTDGAEYPVWMPDFGEIVEMYRDAAGGSCVALGTDKKGRTACGARTGCWNCQAVGEDKSLEAMLENPRHAYMRRLNKIRNYMAALQWDWSRRIWLARSIHPVTGYLRAGPDTFDNATLDQITVATLCADRAEAMRADAFDRAVREGKVPDDEFVVSVAGRAGSPLDVAALPPEARRYVERMSRRQFQVLTPRHLVALDFYRSVLSRGRPFHVLSLARKVWWDGYDMELPTIQATRQSPTPPPVWVELPPLDCEAGIGDPLAVALEEMMNGSAEAEYVGNQAVPEHRIGTEFDVDAEGASLALELEWANGLSAIHSDPQSMPTSAAHYYLRTGIVQVSRRHRHTLDRMLRRTNAATRAGLMGMGRREIEKVAISDQEHTALANRRAAGFREPADVAGFAMA